MNRNRVYGEGLAVGIVVGMALALLILWSAGAIH